MNEIIDNRISLQFLLSLLTTIIIAYIFKEYDVKIKKNEVRYSLWYKSKLELLLSFNSAYLIALPELKRMYVISRNNNKNDEQIECLRKYLLEVEIKSFSLEAYGSKKEGEKISEILAAFLIFEERLLELANVSDSEWINLLSQIEVNASDLQIEVQRNFLTNKELKRLSSQQSS